MHIPIDSISIELPIINYNAKDPLFITNTPSSFNKTNSSYKLPNSLSNNVERPTSPQPLKNTPIYATPAPLPNAIPSSWLELSLQGHSLSFNVMIEGREVAIVVQNPTFLAQVVGEGMRLAMEAYNTHVWMASMLHTPLPVQVPQTLLFHIPTWETPVLYPMEQNPAVMPFLPPTMSNLGMDPLFNPFHLYQQGAPPPVLVPTGSVESSNQGPNNVATSSQLARHQTAGKLTVRELCASYESHVERNRKAGEAEEKLATNSTTQHDRINEYNHMEL
ncbi:hypothetical protein KY290_024644 [Solanum tuberosum]|uniref:Uncharacterized protein n=1 Tax=Solanum tuberosum TaxID=4113 RepID=A0ABQ7UT28_SOLTU|nr:hypothetical protein KY284_023492 [Solanum tuberosum]KAH0754374.1 hypothetical protein KY290_024644 [Solanum tuberosum]